MYHIFAKIYQNNFKLRIITYLLLIIFISNCSFQKKQEEVYIITGFWRCDATSKMKPIYNTHYAEITDKKIYFWEEIAGHIAPYNYYVSKDSFMFYVIDRETKLPKDTTFWGLITKQDADKFSLSNENRNFVFTRKEKKDFYDAMGREWMEQ